MTASFQPGAPDLAGSTAATAPAPTWRDLPSQPPYGPVRPPRTAHLGYAFAPASVEESPGITPTQIALAVGGTLLLVALGIGAALLLLGGDDEVAQTSAVQTEQDGGQLDVQPVPVDPQPDQDAPRGELEPQVPDDPGAQPGDEEGPQPEAPAPPNGQPAPDAPGGQPLPLPELPPSPSAEGDEVPRLFRLRTLPAGTEEDATTIQVEERDDLVVTEQVTTLLAEEGEIAVRATRAEDAEARRDALVDADAREVSVRGQPAHLVDDHRLVWLLPGVGGADPTLVEIDAPPTIGTDALLTVAQGLELLR